MIRVRGVSTSNLFRRGLDLIYRGLFYTILHCTPCSSLVLFPVGCIAMMILRMIRLGHGLIGVIIVWVVVFRLL